MDALKLVPSDATGDGLSLLYGKVARHILPFLVISYLFAYLDRVNVGFAKLQMQGALNFSDAAYGLGAGLFFIGYLLFEVPSNLWMIKVGARRTLCRIMILWGVVSVATMFVRTPGQFYLARFLLGVAEAGFYPGVILYLTLWFPSTRRAGMTAAFVTAIPLSGFLGSPLSGWILGRLDGVHGLGGWQWLFLLEGIPSILLGLAVPFLLCDTPAKAAWLSEGERDALIEDLRRDKAVTIAEGQCTTRIPDMLSNRRVWILCLICFCQACVIYGVSFWLPTLIQHLGHKDPVTIGWLSAIPFGCAAVMVNVIGRSSDHFRERRWHLVVPFGMAAISLVLGTMLDGHPTVALGLLAVATSSAYMVTTVMWSLPSLLISGRALAAAIGMVNSIGGLGGFVSPYLVGVAIGATNRTADGVMIVAFASVVGACLVFAMPAKAINR